MHWSSRSRDLYGEIFSSRGMEFFSWPWGIEVWEYSPNFMIVFWCPERDFRLSVADRLSSSYRSALGQLSSMTQIQVLGSFRIVFWCPERDLNPQFLRKRILRPPCIPFHHLGIFLDILPFPCTPFECRTTSWMLVLWGMASMCRPSQIQMDSHFRTYTDSTIWASVVILSIHLVESKRKWQESLYSNILFHHLR